jgi:hypothetical protein
MIRAISYTVSFGLQLTLLIGFCQGLFGQPVLFDSPTVAVASVESFGSEEKSIRVVLEVSVSKTDPKAELSEVRMDVFWNRNSYPLIGYGPVTAVQSKYDGPLAIERKTESNRSLKARISSGVIENATGGLEGSIDKKESESVRYNEVPQHELLIASGPIQRGTGAYFQFRPSRTETLEGGRNLIISFAVPESWRAGVLQLNFYALGSRQKLGLFRDEFEHSRAFVLPIYLQGDRQAREYALLFARSEQRLRLDWDSYLSTVSTDLLDSLGGLVGLESNNKIPATWVHHLIQNGVDASMERFESCLPQKVASSATAFIHARQQLLELSR